MSPSPPGFSPGLLPRLPKHLHVQLAHAFSRGGQAAWVGGVVVRQSGSLLQGSHVVASFWVVSPPNIIMNALELGLTQDSRDVLGEGSGISLDRYQLEPLSQL